LKDACVAGHCAIWRGRPAVGSRALAVVIGGLCWLIGWKDFLLIWAPSSLLAGSAGIWLLYVQHQFEDAYWKQSSDWSYIDAALHGGSYLKLPRVLQFFS
jgi:omega-6 fatty acid desaturase (delta-12 desaturase)